MDIVIKQRLVGAIILVALGVIFIPVLLDGSGHRSRFGRNIEIPAPPEFREIKPQQSKTNRRAKALPSSLPKKESRQADKKSPPPSPKQVTTPKVASPVTVAGASDDDSGDSTGDIHAWALQVGSFSSQPKALAVRDKLRARGYPAYVSKQKKGSSTTFKVRIGPELERARVEKLKKRVASKEKLEGYIVKHP